MKAIAVYPGKPHSMHLEDVPMPKVTDIPNGQGVLVKVVRVGVDGTDKEINAAEYGMAPEGEKFLITGHENFGQVMEVGPNVPDTITPGTYVVATVRRPGHSIYDRIGLQDMTTDNVYYERGINLRHGYLTEYYGEDAAYMVTLPDTLREVGVLLEPLTVAEKGLNQAYEIQRRLKVWQPRRAAVVGAGTIGLLATLGMRLRGVEVTCYSRRLPPYFNSDLITELGAHYVSSQQATLTEASEMHGPFDIIFEASGFSPLAFQAAEALGNKVMVGTVNASRTDFVSGVNDLVKAEAFFPGWLNKLLTTKVSGLENYAEMLRHLTEDKEAIKIYIEVTQEM
jgi:threonine dehydrogenase-like Zn-dependent dehydrogenase